MPLPLFPPTAVPPRQRRPRAIDPAAPRLRRNRVRSQNEPARPLPGRPAHFQRRRVSRRPGGPGAAVGAPCANFPVSLRLQGQVEGRLDLCADVDVHRARTPRRASAANLHLPLPQVRSHRPPESFQ